MIAYVFGVLLGFGDFRFASCVLDCFYVSALFAHLHLFFVIDVVEFWSPILFS